MPSWLPPGRTVGFLEWLGEGGRDEKRRGRRKEVNEADRMRGKKRDFGGEKGGGGRYYVKPLYTVPV